MSSPSSCVRCSRPLAVLSPAGLCPECAATSATPAPTFLPSTPLGADPSARTRSDDLAAATHSAGADLRHATLPHAPAGYDLLDQLGTGGMGSVYLAREQATERLVAMKFLHQPGNLGAIDRFLVEVRSLAGADHPNIVRVFASDFLRAEPFFTMEYMPGGSLSKLTSPERPVPAAEAVRLIRLVADAVAAAHAREIIHRDLKPSNILLAADGTPKVSDFGLAKRLDRDDGVTLGSGALGTPSYMPPEQISSKNGDLGPWSDVYGLGATLYHLLTGRAPFVGETSEEIIPQVLADPPTRPRALRPDMPAALEGIVVKCLEKDPKDRYQSVAELSADLDRFTAGLRPAAPPLTRWRRARRWARRNRRGATAAALAMLVLAGVFALGALWPKADTPADSVEEMQEALRNGRTVTVIGETGMPKAHRFILEPNVLGESPTGDKTCSFHTFNYALLELFPAPDTDHYRISLEVQTLQATPAAGTEMGFLGVYFGYSAALPPGDRTVHAMFAVRFKDYPRPRDPNNPNPPGKDTVFLQGQGFIQAPTALTPESTTKLGWLPFTVAADRPGPWRPVVIEVSRDELHVRWRADTGEMKTLARWSGDKTRGHYRGLRENLARQAPGAREALPEWTPRMPFGVLAYRSKIALRNVTITPLP